MKKLIFLFGIFAVLSMTVIAQDATVRNTNFNVSLDASDTLSNLSTTLDKTVYLGLKQAVQLYSVQVTVDSISGTPTEAWVLAGSLDNVNFTTISTVNWTGTDGDTTFIITDVSTGVAWPYIRLQGTESGSAKGQLTYFGGRFIDKVR